VAQTVSEGQFGYSMQIDTKPKKRKSVKRRNPFSVSKQYREVTANPFSVSKQYREVTARTSGVKSKWIFGEGRTCRLMMGNWICEPLQPQCLLCKFEGATLAIVTKYLVLCHQPETDLFVSDSKPVDEKYAANKLKEMQKNEFEHFLCHPQDVQLLVAAGLVIWANPTDDAKVREEFIYLKKTEIMELAFQKKVKKVVAVNRHSRKDEAVIDIDDQKVDGYLEINIRHGVTIFVTDRPKFGVPVRVINRDRVVDVGRPAHFAVHVSKVGQIVPSEIVLFQGSEMVRTTTPGRQSKDKLKPTEMTKSMFTDTQERDRRGVWQVRHINTPHIDSTRRPPKKKFFRIPSRNIHQYHRLEH